MLVLAEKRSRALAARQLQLRALVHLGAELHEPRHLVVLREVDAQPTGVPA